MYENIYKNITNSLVENGFIVIENALESSLGLDLLLSAKKSASSFKRAGISTSSALDLNRRRDKISWITDNDRATKEYLIFAKGLQEYLNRHLYLGLKYYEAHFARYDKGDFYEKHLDSFKNFKNRVVTTVYYLNEEYKDTDAGELVIYDKNSKKLKKVFPKQNTLVVFMSEDFLHEVLPTNSTRYSIAGWFRVDKIA